MIFHNINVSISAYVYVYVIIDSVKHWIESPTETESPL